MAEQRQIVVRALLESVYALTHLLIPFIPNGAKMIFEKLGTAPLDLSAVNGDLRNLAVGATISIGDVLYTKLISDSERLDAEAAAKKKAVTHLKSTCYCVHNGPPF